MSHLWDGRKLELIRWFPTHQWRDNRVLCHRMTLYIRRILCYSRERCFDGKIRNALLYSVHNDGLFVVLYEVEKRKTFLEYYYLVISYSELRIRHKMRIVEHLWWYQSLSMKLKLNEKSVSLLIRFLKNLFRLYRRRVDRYTC